MALMVCLAGTLPAAQSGDFRYTDDGPGITITDYPTTAVGAVAIPATINGKPVTRIGESAFRYCSGLTSVTIPDSVASIGDSAFLYCYGLTSVTIGNGVTSIGASAFEGCSKLVGVTIGSGVVSIGASAFRGCSSLTAVTLPYGVTSIGAYAFCECSSLASVTLPDSVTSIGEGAFYDCRRLTQIIIPNSVTSIGDHAFFRCHALTSAALLGNAPSMGVEVFLGTASGFTVYYLEGMAGFGTPTWLGHPAYPGVPPQFTSAEPPAIGNTATAYVHACTASGPPAPTFSVTSGALPDGLALDTDGRISGTPTVRGFFTGTITAANGFLPDATQEFSIDTRSHFLTTGGGNGSVAGAGLYLLNSIASLTATPNPGYVFTGWSGDASGTENPVLVLMDADKVVAGHFAPDLSDPDGDGLTNFDELVTCLTNPHSADSDGDGTPDADEDLDGDGLTNIEELGTYHTMPGVVDTDGDGVSDFAELGRNRFQLVRGSFTWAEAAADARSRGGYLASFTSEAEYSEALLAIGLHALDEVTGVWIGATDAAVEGAWKWTSGEPMAYTRWGPNQPDDSSGADVVEINGGFGTYPDFWVDTPAAAPRDGYILETGFVTDPTNADTDGDGLDDGAEIAIGTPPNWADADGDGYLDGGEFEFGGDPWSPSLVPQWGSRMVGGSVRGSVEFRFLAEPGSTYSVEQSTNLADWTVIETGIIGTGGTVSRLYPTETIPSRWFRARRETAPQ